MCEPVSIGLGVAGLVSSVVGTGIKASAAAKAGEAQAQMYAAQGAQDEINKQYAEQAAKDAVVQGEYDAAQVRGQGTKIAGAQRVAFAGSGVDESSGSAADVQAGTAEMTAVDEANVRRNAMLVARGYRQQGANFSAQAAVAGKSAAAVRQQADQAVTGSIIGGVGDAISQGAGFANQYYSRRLRVGGTVG